MVAPWRCARMPGVTQNGIFWCQSISRPHRLIGCARAGAAFGAKLSVEPVVERLGPLARLELDVRALEKKASQRSAAQA
jgi:hypothetical protein